ncbi:MAG: hypothetical protein QM687_03505 [Ferruginibacter sp.]
MTHLLQNKLFRTLAMLAHAFLNYILISWLFEFDITGSWAGFIFFIILCALLLLLFIRHCISFYKYLQTN